MNMAVEAVLLSYLAMFFAGGQMAARAAGRPIWLFGAAQGRRARAAAMGFRLAFGLAVAGPLLMPGPAPAIAGFAGIMLASAGAMLAFGAQMSMGASWRVGVADSQAGALVTGGLFALSRNPTFIGQGMLLGGAALATFSPLAGLGGLLFIWSARTQIRDEEAVLRATHGADYEALAARVPRWI